jgi:DNA-binding transcriptional LysR family regulator
MEPYQIEAFLAVAREGSFRAGAETIHRSQPAVSVAIKVLEQDLGAPLFERLGRRIRLTPTGKALQGSAAPLFSQWKRLPSRIREEIEGKPRMPVEIGASMSAMLYLLPKFVRGFKKQYPQVEIRLRRLPAKELLDQVRSGEIDFGFRNRFEPTSGVVFKPLAVYNRVLIAPKRHPLGKVRRPCLKDLASYPFVLHGIWSTTRQLVERAFEHHNIRFSVSLHTDSWEVVKVYVALGLGIGVVPEFVLTEKERCGMVIIPAGHLFADDTYGIWMRKERDLSASARAFMREMERNHWPGSRAHLLTQCR